MDKYRGLAGMRVPAECYRDEVDLVETLSAPPTESEEGRKAAGVRLKSHSRGGRSTSRGATRISHAKTSSASRSVSSATTRLESASAKFSAGVSGLSNSRSRPTLETHPRLVTDEMKAEPFASCYANVIRSFEPPDRLAASAALVSCAAGHEGPHRLLGKRQ